MRERVSVAGTFEACGEVANIQPVREREVVEVEDLDPPGGGQAELAGLMKSLIGDSGLTLNFSTDL